MCHVQGESVFCHSCYVGRTTEHQNVFSQNLSTLTQSETSHTFLHPKPYIGNVSSSARTAPFRFSLGNSILVGFGIGNMATHCRIIHVPLGTVMPSLYRALRRILDHVRGNRATYPKS